jgi:hypothetical protein
MKLRFMVFLIAGVVMLTGTQVGNAYQSTSRTVKYLIVYDGKDGAILGFGCQNRHWKLKVCTNNVAGCVFVRVGEKVRIPLTCNRKLILYDENNQSVWFKRSPDEERLKVLLPECS